MRWALAGLSLTGLAHAASTPACVAAKDADGHHVVMGKTRLPLHEPKSTALGWDVVTFPLDAGAVLVSTRGLYLGHGGPDATLGTLLRVPCADPGKASVFAKDAGADFGHAALSADGATLYYSDGTGVSALSLKTRGTRALTRGGTIPAKACWSEQDTAANDVVLSLTSSGAVAFVRGGACGFESDWEGRPYVIVDPQAATPTVERASLISTIAADADGNTLWMGDAGGCSPVISPGTKAHVWRSGDGGESWSKVPVPGLNSAVAAVLPDARRPGHLVILSGMCATSANVAGGSLRATRDGGKTWTPVPLARRMQATDGGDGIERARLIKGDIDQIAIYGPERTRQAKGRVAMTTRDGGKSWSLGGPQAPISHPTRATLGTARFEATPGGVMRTRDGRRERVFPR